MSTSLLAVAESAARRLSVTAEPDPIVVADPSDAAMNRGLWSVPEIGRLAIINFLMMVGPGLPGMYYIPSYVSEVMGDDAASFLSWIDAASYAAATVGAIYLGKLSDDIPRKRMVILSMVVTWLPSLLMLFITDRKATVIVFAICNVVLAPLNFWKGAAPVVAAWWADKLLPEQRQVGFAVLSAVGILGNSCVSIGFVAIAEALSLPVPRASLWVSNACLFIAFPVVFSTRGDPARSDRPSEDRGAILSQAVLEPLRFAWRDQRMRAACGVAAFVTFSTTAVGGIFSILLFSLGGIAGEGHEDEQDMMMYYVTWGSLTLVPVTCIIGMLSKRFGSERVLHLLTPVASLMFGLPSFVAVANNPFTICLSALGSAMPATIFLPLQVIVTHLVPADKVGEALGSLGACKNLVSLFAPLVMGVVFDALEAEGREDLYWVICPALAVLMLGAWPFSLRLAKAEPADEQANLAQLSLQPVES